MVPQEDLNRVIQTVSKLYDFTDGGARGRRVLMQQAKLNRFLANLDLSGAPSVVAGDIVNRLADFGYLPERSTYHALGALLSYLLGLNDLASDDAQFLATIIVRYALVTDPAYMAQLRDYYQIDDPSAAAPLVHPYSPPPSPPYSIAEPTFEVAIEDSQSLETILNSEDNFLDIQLLGGAIYGAQAVCRIEIPEGKAVGTGLLISSDLVLTNQHVLKDQAYLDEAVCRFNYMVDPSTKVASPGRPVRFKSDIFFASPAHDLDYAVGRLKEAPLSELSRNNAGADGASPWEMVIAGRHRGYLALVPRRIVERERVNIIQHPDGNPMKVVLTQNYVVHVGQTRVQYIADTMGGSSGSPVFNQNWEVVALHHSGAPYPPDALSTSLTRAWKRHLRVNEGVPMRAILEDFRRRDIERFLPA